MIDPALLTREALFLWAEAQGTRGIGAAIHMRRSITRRRRSRGHFSKKNLGEDGEGEGQIKRRAGSRSLAPPLVDTFFQNRAPDAKDASVASVLASFTASMALSESYVPGLAYRQLLLPTGAAGGYLALHL